MYRLCSELRGSASRRCAILALGVAASHSLGGTCPPPVHIAVREVVMRWVRQIAGEQASLRRALPQRVS